MRELFPQSDVYVVVYLYTIKHHSVGSPLDPPLYIVVPPTRSMYSGRSV